MQYHSNLPETETGHAPQFTAVCHRMPHETQGWGSHTQDVIYTASGKIVNPDSKGFENDHNEKQITQVV